MLPFLSRQITLMVILGQLPTLSAVQTNSSSVVEWLKPNSAIQFDAKDVPHFGLLNRLNWVEKNERSTSRNYTLWEKADLYLLEWPGNVTLFHPDKLVVKWGRHRAKYVEDHCGLENTGIEMRAYAYKYVYLTWGPYRLTKTYTPPLRIPRFILSFSTLARLSRKHNYEENLLNTVTVFDFAFAYDSLLLAFPDGIIRVSGLEMGWAEMSKNSLKPLKYSVSKDYWSSTVNMMLSDKGVKDVDRLVTQSCCLKSDYCPFADFVVAYRESSSPHIIFTSLDGGKTFKRLQSLPETSNLRVVLSYPDFNQLLLFHGNSTNIKVNRAILSPHSYRKVDYSTSLLSLEIAGAFQGGRIGMEVSFVLWDNCSVWYSFDLGHTVTKSLFYVHTKISNVGRAQKHLILPKHCSFGENSTLAYGKTGQFGLLDNNNVFFLGIDTKSNLSQLVALKVDMSLMLPNTGLSVTPYFDEMEQPKLIYPPKYLELPAKFNLGKSYRRRLGMRLLPKNLYPSDFILSFYDEYARLPKPENFFSLKPCQTSSLSVNNSITQRRKLYSVSLIRSSKFTITFKSQLSSSRQLKVEPRSTLKYLSIQMTPVSVDMVEPENPRYWIKYNIQVKPSTASALNKLFRLNFYTTNNLRCNIQPRVTVYIKVEDTVTTSSNNLSDEDMEQRVYLKSVTAGRTEYLSDKKVGETLKVDGCPLSKNSM